MNKLNKQGNLDPNVEQALNVLITDLKNNNIIKQYKTIDNQVKAHESLTKLADEIKHSQKQIVNLGHYKKVNAESIELEKLTVLKKQFDSHPLVESYRQHLNEADDLLQYIVKKIEHNINQNIEQSMSENDDKNKGSENFATKN